MPTSTRSFPETATAPLADRQARIRALNDRFRRTLVGGRVTCSDGINALALGTRRMILDRVRTYDAFDGARDPHQEHDLGQFAFAGLTILWKIDYFDRSLEMLSDDPSDPVQTVRVLTIMLAEEY
jgi:hypothetical protein